MIQKKAASMLAAMLRELERNPESPASLEMTAAVNGALRPVENAINALVVAIADHIDRPGPTSKAAIASAEDAFVISARQAPDDDFCDEVVQCAHELVMRRRQQPPKMETILDIETAPRDLEYEIAGTLGGIQGTWECLAMALAMRHYFEAIGHSDPSDETIDTYRCEFEYMLGRTIAAHEWDRLLAWGRWHAVNVLPSTMAGFQPGGNQSG